MNLNHKNFYFGAVFLLIGLSIICYINCSNNSTSIKNRAAIIVDVQNDFTEFKHGSLAVPNSNKDYIEKINFAASKLKNKGLPVFATQDWHPADHISFASNHKNSKIFDTVPVYNASGEVIVDNKNHPKFQTLWPVHCLQNKDGSTLLVDNKYIDQIIQKGTNKNYDSYSGFKDDSGDKTNLEKQLKELKVKELMIFGIATDYCVKATVIDAINAGFKVSLVTDLSRGVTQHSSKVAIEEMKNAGAQIISELNI